MPQRNEPIAVIGSAFRFPGECDTPSKLWDLLKQPSDLLQTVPANRFDAKAWYHPDSAHHGTSNVTKSYFLSEDPATFDTQFFNIPPNECEAIDPQQRMLLETVYNALSAAGIPMESLRGTSTACYVGQMCDDWSGILMRDWDSIPQYAATGISRSIMSNRISYFFDWHGPSMTIDTACSSSLVAVHEAVQVLRSGDSPVAVACGANLILTPGMYIAESKLKMLSPDGRSRMWDADANGYARGEGIAAVVLKTLSQAIKDGDHIDCIIRETGLNQDGRTTGITMPSSKAQAALIRRTYAKAGLDPLNPLDRPQFFHAHGTGTPAGDPQEAEAISKTFFQDDESSEKKLYVGSIKTVIGHTEGTAGLASLIGTSLALQNKTIPPNMHLQKLSEKVAPFCQNLEVPIASQAWPKASPGQPLRASVNSFGFGGANAHAILESYEPMEPRDSSVETPLFTPLTFSANSEKALRRMLDDTSEFLSATSQTNLRDIAWTLQNRRSVLPYKTAISGRTFEEIVASIDLARATKDSLGVRSSPSKDLEILGIFTGQGAQWPTMGAKLIKSSPYARGVIAKLDQSLQDLPASDRPSWFIKDELEAGAAKSRLAEAALSQPLCTAVQVVLVDLIKAAGIKFKAVVGHSSGEIAAAYASGFVSATDAIRIAYYRGVYAKLAASSSGKKGAMLAVGTSLQDAEEFCGLEQFENRLTVAASNAAASVTLSGDEDAVEEAKGIFKDESKFARTLKVDTAYHSFHMLPCSQPYLEAMGRCSIQFKDDSSSTTWFSSVHLDTKMSKDTLNGQYWVDNMKNPVLFSQAIAAAVQHSGPFDLAIEIGPHPALKGPALENIEEASGVSETPYTGLLSRGTDDVKAFSAALGYLWERFGPSAVDFEGYDKLVAGESDTNLEVAVDLPLYPWDHDTRYWTESRVSGSYKTREAGPHPILGVKLEEGTTGQQRQWRNLLFPREIPWMSGHKLQGQIVFPASGYISMAVEAMLTLAGNESVELIEITDFIIGRAISFLDDSTGIEVNFNLGITDSGSNRITASFQVSSCPRGEHVMNLNASGTISIDLGEESKDALYAAPVPEFNMTDVEVDRFYKTLSDMGYNYAHPFKAVSSIRRRTDSAVGKMTDVRGDGWEDELLIHPGFIDTSFQTVFAAFSSPGDERLWSIHVPTNIKRLSINPALAKFPQGKEAVWPWQSCITSGPQSSPVANIEVFAENGRDLLLEVEGIKLVPFAQATEESDSQLFSNFVYDLAKPDGLIASPNVPTEFDIKLAKDSERFSFYWIAQVVNSITSEEEDQTLVHYKRMLKWCRFIVDQVLNGENPYVGPEAKYDTLEFVEELIKPYGDRADLGLIRAVGQNLPNVIRTRGNIVEYMVKDGMLDAFYEEGLGLHIANIWEANMAAQVVHRYPRMNILEIGGGTGGSTRMILPKLGKAFSSYTFTDISAGFFDAAEERFKEYSDRMIFRTFDMEKDITEQGYLEGHYDMVLASNVLHAGADLDMIMSNVRRLVKPGGWLINMETATYYPTLRNGFAMAGLPGWWCGADTGRPWGPTIPIDEWDKLYKRTGWSGVDTYPPHINDLHHFTVMATQAVDDRINFLREPLSIEPTEANRQQLVIVGGVSDTTADISEKMLNHLRSHFSEIVRVDSLEEFVGLEIDGPPVVVNLSELDVPIMEEIMNDQPEKHDALKDLFSRATDILWVTKNNRWQNPYTRMLVGMARSFRKEYPGLQFQALDVDVLDSESSRLFAECLLRHLKLCEWNGELESEKIHWSEELEIHLENGRFYVPRLKPIQDMNDRYNSTRRQITRNVDPSNSEIELVVNENSYELREPSPLKISDAVEDGVTIRVSKSLLQSVKIPGAGHYLLCYGVNEAGESVVALSSSSESVVTVPKAWVMPYSGKVDSAQVLLSLAANFAASAVIGEAPPNTSLLAHDPEPIVASALIKQASSKRIRVSCTTFHEGRKGAHWIYIHPKTPRRTVKKKLPKDISTFVNFSRRIDKNILATMEKDMPFGCAFSDQSEFFSTIPHNSLAANAKAIGEYLLRAWSMAKSANFALSSKRPTVPLHEVSNYSDPLDHLAVVDWDVKGEVSINTQPIDSAHTLFKADRTYLMVGLSGEVGQSITQWMVRHGARHIVLTSRNPRVSLEWMEGLEDEYGATIRAMSLDVTDREALHSCYNKICRTMPPIAGVAHGAMVLVDNLFQNMSYEDLMTALRPKVLGAIHLDELFSEDTLDFFILFSSITGVVGNTGQTNYIGANFFLESLGLQRRRRSLVASVIGISSLVGIGYVERSENFDADHFSRLGYRNVSEQDVHMLFAEAILRGRPDSTGSHEIITGIVPRYPTEDGVATYLQDVKFNHLILERTSEKQDANSSIQIPVRTQLQTASTEDEVRNILQDGFSKRIKKILRVPEDVEFSTTTSLVEQGVDSLVAVEVRSWFLKEVEVDVPVLKVLGGASINDLLREALQRLSPEMVPQLGSQPAAPAEAVKKPVQAQPDLLLASPSPAHNVPSLNGYFPKTKGLNSEPKGKPDQVMTHVPELRKVQDEPNRTNKDENQKKKERKRKDDQEKAAREMAQVEKENERRRIEEKKRKDEQEKAAREQLRTKEEKVFNDLRRTEITERMSFGQSRFWFLYQALKDKTTFNMAIMIRLEGRIRIKDLEKAVQVVTLRHEALRTRYFSTGEFMANPMQGIIQSSTVNLESKKIRNESDAYRELDEIRAHEWDLGRWDTMKVSLLSASDTMHYLIIGCHHISMDGFGFNIFFSELEKAYKGQALPVLPLTSQYRAFAKRQHQDWERGRLNEDLDYYRNIVPKDAKPLPLFPFARNNTRRPLDAYGSHKVEARIDASLTNKIKLMSRKYKCTAFHFYLATLQLLVFRLLDDCDDFFMGVADANRIDEKFMNTLGFLLNILPLRFERSSAKTFSQALQQSRNKAYSGLVHSRLPFNILLEQLDVPRSAAHTPLFQIFVDYRQGVQERQKYMGLKAEGEKWHIARTGYDVTLDILENPEGDSRLELGLQKQLYTEENGKLLMEGFVNLLKVYAHNPEVDWNIPDVWPKATIEKALKAGRGDQIDYTWGPTVVHRIDNIISQHGSEIALKDGTGRAITYSQMGRRVGAICSALMQFNGTNGARVAVFQAPSSDWICSMLAIFRTGAVYVPLDLRTPLPRLAAIANEAQVDIILTDNQTSDDVAALGTPNAKIINVSALPVAGDIPQNFARPGAPAVILFTSGSTGTPKGIHINHTNVVRQVEGYSKQCNIQTSGCRILQQSAYSFDKSLQQVFLALAHGGALFIVPSEQRGDPTAQVQLMASEKITHTTATPSEYLMWFRYAKDNIKNCKSWSTALLGGEPATEALLAEFRQLGLPLRVLNSYGPAEITMSCAKGDVSYSTAQAGEPILAGYTLPNYATYIVNDKLQPVPLGIPGEIIIGGIGVGDGYLTNKELTKQKFLPDAFGGSGMMYRTGDRGRLSENGALFCDGRLEGDTQIKLRGVRMELEDIENTIIKTASGALDAVVVTLQGDVDSAFLAAHVVFSQTYTDNPDTFLERLPPIVPLPQYMIPSVFVKLDRLPLTAHLKVDRRAVKALPLPEQSDMVSEGRADLSVTESQLASTWRQVITRAPALRADSNFFSVGGNSLVLVKLQAMLRTAFHVNLGLMEIMNAATLGDMARLIDDARRVGQIDWDAETALPGPSAQTGHVVNNTAPRKQNDLVVMVTGATGVLGQRIVAHLASDARIKKIYAVAVRPKNTSSAERIQDPTGKVVVQSGDLDQPLLGLSIPDVAAISNEIDAIFHLGANRSFWDSYHDLRSTNVSSIKEIISIANARRASIHFVSSGGVSSYASSPPPTDGSDGYVASKWAAEALLSNAAKRLGLQCTIHRPTKTSGISDAPPEVLDELLALARIIKKRPVLDGLSGSLGLIPAKLIAKSISDALFDESLSLSTGATIVPQESVLNVAVVAFAERLREDNEVLSYEGMPALKWMGVAKKMGWSQFMVGQDLIMSNEGDQVVNRR